MKSWTRTLNLDDAHTLLALARPGLSLEAWTEASYGAIEDLSGARRRELIRILRDGFLDWNEREEMVAGLFLRFYQDAPATAQIDLVDAQWALSHPITLLAVEKLVAPALASGRLDIKLEAVEALVAAHVVTESDESARKTRTVLLGALENLGTLVGRGTGQHRSLQAARGSIHPLVFGYLVHRDLRERGLDAMMSMEVSETSLPVRLTCCEPAEARASLRWCLRHKVLVERDDEIGLPT